MRWLYATWLLALALALGSAAGAKAAPIQCKTIAVTTSSAAFTDVDISGGAVTTDQFPVAVSWGTDPRYTYLMVAVDITDANGGISNVRLTFTATETDAGTFRKVPLCLNSAPTLTCGAVAVDWDPQTHGKNWWIDPVDWGYLFGKITLTPTGHGAGDKATLTVRGCRE